MRLPSLGRHLHSQIVIPLMAAALSVAVVASFIGVSELSKIIGSWVDGNVRQTDENASMRFDSERTVLGSDAALIAEDQRLDAAIKAGASAKGRFNADELNAFLVKVEAAFKGKGLMVLDEQGRVVGSNGVFATSSGQRPLPDSYTRWQRLGMNMSTFVEIQGKPTLSASRRVEGPNGAIWAAVVSEVIDDAFLKSSLTGLGSGFAFVDGNGRFAARFIDTNTMDPADVAQLGNALQGRDPRVIAALRDPGMSPQDLQIGGHAYRILARPLKFPSTSDPAQGSGYILAVVSMQVQNDAGGAIVRLIALWSLFAVVLLTAFGMMVAQRVSEPLVRLADSAHLVAEGDFTHRVPITGSNEISALAESFNQMTDSLRQRTEGVTKKVLELATLYEMSRALGSTLDLDTLLDSVLDSALRIFNVESGYVVLRERNTERLEIRAWRGSSGGRPDERALRNSMCEWVTREGRPLIFNPPGEGGASGQVDLVTGANAALCVPLVSNEGVIGAVAVGSRDPGFRFSSDDVRLLSTIANHATIAIGNIELFSSLQDAYIATVRSLAAAVDAKDPFTRGHSERVARCAMAIAERLELSTDQCTALEMAAYLHDIGKIGIREEILLKPGRLDDDEMAQMRHHPLIGANILKPVAFPWAIAPIVRHHHEHWDGCGYPAGLRGEEIPLLARILATADAYEAMTSDRPYRRGRTRDEAIEELKRCAAHQFDPRVVDAFIGVLSDEPEQGSEAARRIVEEIQPDEARAIFVAVCDGMLASFRRLGGPRLSANLENDLNRHFAADEMPFTFSGGRLTGTWNGQVDREQEMEAMRRALTTIADSMARTSGHSLVDGFYTEAISGLSDRMRHLAVVLDLYRKH